jgi:hypothetical protein
MNIRENKRLSMSFRAKRALVRTSLLALGAAFETVSKRSAELKAEIEDLEDGYVFSIGVLPDGPAISLKKEGNRIRYLGRGYRDPNVKILFKNMDAAVRVCVGIIGTHTAAAQHLTLVHGNIGEAVKASRAMSMVQTYLYPRFILTRTRKRRPKLTPAQLLLKVWVMATLAFAMLASAGR